MGGERRRRVEATEKMRGRDEGKASERRMGGRKAKVALGKAEREADKEAGRRKEKEEPRWSRMVEAVDCSMDLTLGAAEW